MRLPYTIIYLWVNERNQTFNSDLIDPIHFHVKGFNEKEMAGNEPKGVYGRKRSDGNGA